MARIVNMTLRNNVVATYEGEVQDGKPQGFALLTIEAEADTKGNGKMASAADRVRVLPGWNPLAMRANGGWCAAARANPIIPMEPLLMKESD